MNYRMNTTLIQEIEQERDNQDKEWGGQQHDDEHGPSEWCDFIQSQSSKARYFRTPTEWRERMVKVAALAVAAIESHDRLKAHEDAVERPL